MIIYFGSNLLVSSLVLFTGNSAVDFDWSAPAYKPKEEGLVLDWSQPVLLTNHLDDELDLRLSDDNESDDESKSVNTVLAKDHDKNYQKNFRASTGKDLLVCRGK